MSNRQGWTGIIIHAVNPTWTEELPMAKTGLLIGHLSTRFTNDLLLSWFFLLSWMPQLTHTLNINNLEFYGSGSPIDFLLDYQKSWKACKINPVSSGKTPSQSSLDWRVASPTHTIPITIINGWCQRSIIWLTVTVNLFWKTWEARNYAFTQSNIFQMRKNTSEMFLTYMRATLTVGKPHCSTWVHYIASSCLSWQLRWVIFNFLHDCIKTSVQGADPGTSRDAGAVWSTAFVDKFEERLHAAKNYGM